MLPVGGAIIIPEYYLIDVVWSIISSNIVWDEVDLFLMSYSNINFFGLFFFPV